jgi:hypothetical protein
MGAVFVKGDVRRPDPSSVWQPHHLPIRVTIAGAHGIAPLSVDGWER